MQANLNSFEDLERESGIAEFYRGGVPFQHDRNHSLPTASLNFQNESTTPIKIKLNRAATVSKTENLKQFPLNPSFKPEIAVSSLETFSINSYQNSDVGRLDPPPPDLGILTSHSISPAINNTGPLSSTAHHADAPVTELHNLFISIPDLPDPQLPSAVPMLPFNSHYEEPPSLRSMPSAIAPPNKPKLSNDGKNPSEYALHILFTQVIYTLSS